MQYLTALLAGSLFGGGLHLSGMTDTAKVQGWLDIFGNWDPTLAFVLGGAMLPMAIAWQFTARREAALSGTPFPPPAPTTIDRKLVIGSVMFGAGWGLAGLCPGPVVAALSYGGTGLLIFLAAMIAGMGLSPLLSAQLEKAIPAE